MANYWNTPTHAGAATPLYHIRRAARTAAAILFTAAVVAAFLTLAITI